MGLTRLIKWIGLVALVAGIIGFLLPGQFIYFPTLDAFLTQFGDALFKGISSNPTVKLFIAKAPAISLAVIGCSMVFWGTMKDVIGPEETAGANPQNCRKSIKERVESQKAEDNKCRNYTKSASELADRKKP